MTSSLVQAWCSVFELPPGKEQLWGVLHVGVVPLPQVPPISLRRQQQLQQQALDESEAGENDDERARRLAAALVDDTPPAQAPTETEQVAKFYDDFAGDECVKSVRIEFFLIAPKGDVSTVAVLAAATPSEAAASARHTRHGDLDENADDERGPRVNNIATVSGAELPPAVWRCEKTIGALFAEKAKGVVMTPAYLLAVLRAKFLDARPNFAASSASSASVFTSSSSSSVLSELSRRILLPAFADATLPPLQFGTASLELDSSRQQQEQQRADFLFHRQQQQQIAMSAAAVSASRVAPGSEDDDFNRFPRGLSPRPPAGGAALLRGPSPMPNVGIVAGGGATRRARDEFAVPFAFDSSSSAATSMGRGVGGSTSVSMTPSIASAYQHGGGAGGGAVPRAGFGEGGGGGGGLFGAAHDSAKCTVAIQPSNKDSIVNEVLVHVDFRLQSRIQSSSVANNNGLFPLHQQQQSSAGHVRFLRLTCQKVDSDLEMQAVLLKILQMASKLFSGAVTLRNAHEHARRGERAAREDLATERASFNRQRGEQLAQFIDVLNAKKDKLASLQIEKRLLREDAEQAQRDAAEWQRRYGMLLKYLGAQGVEVPAQFLVELKRGGDPTSSAGFDDEEGEGNEEKSGGKTDRNVQRGAIIDVGSDPSDLDDDDAPQDDDDDDNAIDLIGGAKKTQRKMPDSSATAYNTVSFTPTPTTTQSDVAGLNAMARLKDLDDGFGF